MKQLPIINLLRTFSIIGVLGYHLNIPYFSLGYLGVDLFFILSGLVISRSILNDPNFSLSQFYKKRFLRLLPEMSLMIAVVFFIWRWQLAGFIDRIDFADFINSMPYLLSHNLNNFLAFTKQNYFSPYWKEYPFLHLWSLAVEIQFYLLCPIMLKKYSNKIIYTIGLVSFIFYLFPLAEISFYFTLSRLWLFILGYYIQQKNILAENFNIPTPLQFLGQKSYSIYIWHWPIIVLFSKYYSTTFLMMAALIISLFSDLLFTQIRKLNFKINLSIYLVLSILVASLLTSFDPQITKLKYQEPTLVESILYRNPYQKCFMGSGDWQAHDCSSAHSTENVQVDVFGNSYALSIFPSLNVENKRLFSRVGYLMPFSNYIEESQKEFAKSVENTIQIKHGKMAIIAINWMFMDFATKEELKADIQKVIKKLEELGYQKIFFLQQLVRFDQHAIVCLNSKNFSQCHKPLDEFKTKYQQWFEFVDSLPTLSDKIKILDINPNICPKGICSQISDDHRLIISDEHHPEFIPNFMNTFFKIAD